VKKKERRKEADERTEWKKNGGRNEERRKLKWSEREERGK
jgi:hypothetical protein